MFKLDSGYYTVEKIGYYTVENIRYSWLDSIRLSAPKMVGSDAAEIASAPA